MENLRYNMRVNCDAVFELMLAATPALKEAGAKWRGLQEAFDVRDPGGNFDAARPKTSPADIAGASPSFLTISSVNGVQSFPGCASYCMSKAAVDQLTRCVALCSRGELFTHDHP